MFKVKRIELRLKEELARAKIDADAAAHYARGHRQMNEYECTWHKKVEERGIEIAKLDALIEGKNIVVKEFSSLLAEKDRTIATLTKAIDNLTRE